MEFKSIIENLFTLFENNIIDTETFKSGVQNTFQSSQFIPVDFEYQINDYGFEVDEAGDKVVVTAYHGGKKLHTRVLDDNTHPQRVRKYCNKFATDYSYRSMRMSENY